MTMQRKSTWLGCSVLVIGFLLAACRLADDVGPVGVLGYNHTDTDISQFLVDGAAGGSFVEAHHHGGTSCCVSIPKNWRSGLTVEVEWTTDLKVTSDDRSSFQNTSPPTGRWSCISCEMAM
jgi:hypothetical protein